MSSELWHVFRNQINRADGLTVATVTEFVPGYRDQSDRNARLIAAAPGMYDALKSIAANTCCDKCQEAALVATGAIARVDSV